MRFIEHIHTNYREEKSDDLENTPKDGPFRRLELVSRSKCSSSQSNGIKDSNIETTMYARSLWYSLSFLKEIFPRGIPTTPSEFQFPREN